MSEVAGALTLKQATSIAQLASTQFWVSFFHSVFFLLRVRPIWLWPFSFLEKELILVAKGAGLSELEIAKARSATTVLFGVGISIMASLRMFPFVVLKRFPPLRRTRHHVNLAARLKLQIQSLQAMLFSPLPVTWLSALYPPIGLPRA